MRVPNPTIHDLKALAGEVITKVGKFNRANNHRFTKNMRHLSSSHLRASHIGHCPLPQIKYERARLNIVAVKNHER